jgi:hypothetical protein
VTWTGLVKADSQRVYIGYPHGDEGSCKFFHSLIPTYILDGARNRRLDLIANSSGANVTNARNEIAAQFLDTDGDWLLFIDTDMVFDGRDGRAGVDIVDRLVRAAHPEKRPILGALCFSWQKGTTAAPTLYVLRQDGKVGRLFNYPRDQIVEVDATGTGCLLIHRSVLERMRDRRSWSAAYPWFQESAVGDLPVGEDITFCIRARTCGFPVHVDTSIKVGHEKPVVIDHNVYEAQQASRRLEPPKEPTFVVIATAGDRQEILGVLWKALIDDPAIHMPAGNRQPGHIFTYLNSPQSSALAEPFISWLCRPDANLHQMWNEGLDAAEKLARAAGFDTWNVAVLNDDLEVEPGFLTRLARGLRADDSIWLAYPNNAGIDI